MGAGKNTFNISPWNNTSKEKGLKIFGIFASEEGKKIVPLIGESAASVKNVYLRNDISSSNKESAQDER